MYPQGDINRKKVKQDSIEGSIIRCGYGTNLKQNDDK